MYEKSCGLSFDFSLLRRKNALLFWRKSHVCFSLVTPGVFPHACRCAGADTRSCIAHSASLKFLPSPFITNGLKYRWLCVKFERLLVLHRWREIEVKHSPTKSCPSMDYPPWVKRWRQKTKNSGRAYTRVRWGGCFWEWRAASRFNGLCDGGESIPFCFLWIIGVVKIACGSRNAYLCQSFYES